MQQIMRWGHDFPRIGRGGMLNLEPLSKTHKKYQLPLFLSFSPTIHFYQNLIEVVTAWKGKTMGKNSSRAPILEERVLNPWARKNPKNVLPFPHALTF